MTDSLDGAAHRFWSQQACYVVQETEVAPIIAAHWERASFPYELIPKLRKLNLGEPCINLITACGEQALEQAHVTAHHTRGLCM